MREEAGSDAERSGEWRERKQEATQKEAVMQMVIVYLHDAGGYEEAESETQEVVNACVLFDFSCLLTLRPLLWVELPAFWLNLLTSVNLGIFYRHRRLYRIYIGEILSGW